MRLPADVLPPLPPIPAAASRKKSRFNPNQIICAICPLDSISRRCLRSPYTPVRLAQAPCEPCASAPEVFKYPWEATLALKGDSADDLRLA